tara:strand:+ start:814 stop:990 length:177 start_codon:yes stop_codon:yes gene_type:complete
MCCAVIKFTLKFLQGTALRKYKKDFMVVWLTVIVAVFLILEVAAIPSRCGNVAITKIS